MTYGTGVLKVRGYQGVKALCSQNIQAWGSQSTGGLGAAVLGGGFRDYHKKKPSNLQRGTSGPLPPFYSGGEMEARRRGSEQASTQQEPGSPVPSPVGSAWWGEGGAWLRRTQGPGMPLTHL